MPTFRSRLAGQFAMLVLLFAAAEAQASSKPSEAELAAISARGVALIGIDPKTKQATGVGPAAGKME